MVLLALRWYQLLSLVFLKTHWQIDVWYSTPSQPRRLYQGNSFESIACKTGTDPQHTHTQETIFFTCKRPTYKELLDHQYISEHRIYFFYESTCAQTIHTHTQNVPLTALNSRGRCCRHREVVHTAAHKGGFPAHDKPSHKTAVQINNNKKWPRASKTVTLTHNI